VPSPLTPAAILVPPAIDLGLGQELEVIAEGGEEGGRGGERWGRRGRGGGEVIPAAAAAAAARGRRPERACSFSIGRKG
jgi:hypothetical protein